MRVEGIALHSPYDPVREARRFSDTSLGTEKPSAVVVLGEGLGYLSESIAQAHPAARVIRVYYSRDVFQAASKRGPTGDAWHPDLGCDLVTFFRERIGELDVEGLRVIEWPASAQLFPADSRSANEAIQQCLREANGSFVTTVAMGRLWIRNSFSNFLGLASALQGAPCSKDRPVVIAASGPSLERAAATLRAVRNAIDIWALPSSALFLHEAGLRPDLIVLTDPGFYAIRHLHHCGTCPVAMPLSAARGLWDWERPQPFLLAQPGFVEPPLLSALGIPAPVIAPHGTVAATALDLALASTRGPVIFAGLDMCTNDVVSHARPNEFETFFHLQSARTVPYDSMWFRRSTDQNPARVPGSPRSRAPLPLKTYAGWLSAVARDSGREIYRLVPSAVELGGMTSLDEATFTGLVRGRSPSRPGPQFSPTAPLPDRRSRVAVARAILSGWKDALAEGLKAARGVDGYRAIDTARLLDLAYQIEARMLMDAKRKTRLGDARGARETVVTLLRECGSFVQALNERIESAA